MAKMDENGSGDLPIFFRAKFQGISPQNTRNMVLTCTNVPPSVGSWRSPIESVKPPAFKFQNLIRSLSGLYHHVYTKRSYDKYHINTRINLILYIYLIWLVVGIPLTSDCSVYVCRFNRCFLSTNLVSCRRTLDANVVIEQRCLCSLLEQYLVAHPT